LEPLPLKLIEEGCVAALKGCFENFNILYFENLKCFEMVRQASFVQGGRGVGYVVL
jgi:hypothetical protein